MSDTQANAVLIRLGRRLRELRRAKGLTQEQLAAAAEISRTYAGALEAGMKGPSLAVLVRLAKALGVDIAELFLEPSKAPSNSRAVIARITSRLIDSDRSAADLLKLEAMIGAFLSK